MKWPKLPKFRLPKWISQISLKRIFHGSESSKSFYRHWLRYYSQIPHESRTLINSYQHFIVLGHSQSGKTDLIQGVTEQCQDLYPFDTTYAESADIQFYLGPTQMIQELSYGSLEDKSIRGRKRCIKLWKKLYAKRDPIVIIVCNCMSSAQNNTREFNRLAQLIAGKVSLLSEISRKRLKVRIALTHLDKIPGYLEFARFLKQENLTFDIPLTSSFETNSLEFALKHFFEDHITLMLTSSSPRDFSKMLTFSKEMPSHFKSVEDFLRVLVSRVSFTRPIELEKLSLTSNQEPNSSFSSFAWTRPESMDMFFRYPLLKHQFASAGLLLLLVSPLVHSYFHDRNELSLTEKGIHQLNLLQYNKFQEEFVPLYVSSFSNDPSNFLNHLNPHFFGKKLDQTANKLAERIRKHYFERSYQKAILENQGELKCLYFQSLSYACCNNDLGEYILDESKRMASALNVDENLLKAYINCSKNRCKGGFQNIAMANPVIAITSFAPWINFFNKYEEICSQQIFLEQNCDEISQEAEKLLSAVEYLKKDDLPYGIANLLIQEMGSEECSENVKVIYWIADNSDRLSSFLQIVRNSTKFPFETEAMNIRQFFSKIKTLSALKEKEDQNYNFSINDQLFSLHTKTWFDLVVGHNVEKAIRKYTEIHKNSTGAVFFNSRFEEPYAAPPLNQGPFPHFSSIVEIPGRYTHYEYENTIRFTSENLFHLINNLPINPEEKNRFKTFLICEANGYLATYKSHYLRLFQSCDIQGSSLNGLKGILHNLAQDSSDFYGFLKFMENQTAVLSEPLLTLNMYESNPFAFLTKLLTVEGDQIPYTEYQKVIQDLIRDLDAKTLKNDCNLQKTLKHFLTNPAIISSNILKNDPNSYVNRIKDCLNTAGVPDEYQRVFLMPVVQLYKLGLKDLKRGIEHVWTESFQPKIDCVLSKFPFNPESCESLCFDELEATFNPTSDFYKNIKEVMDLCCVSENGMWIQSDSQELQLSEAILAQLNQIQKISNLLWDSEGCPQPINFWVQTVPFIDAPENNPIITKTYFFVGEQCVKNFNQEPFWQMIQLDWWKTETASVGVELKSKYSSTCYHQYRDKPNCPWSFFELLRDACEEDNNILTWSIKSTKGQEMYYASLAFKKDPKFLLLAE